ncbi:MAG: hypothetical protein WDZ81_01405 [Candidatus Saccharimonadales bacterium]
MATLTQRMDELTKRLESHYGSLDRRIDRQNRKIDGLARRVKGLEDLLGELETTVSTHEATPAQPRRTRSEWIQDFVSGRNPDMGFIGALVGLVVFIGAWFVLAWFGSIMPDPVGASTKAVETVANLLVVVLPVVIAALLAVVIFTKVRNSDPYKQKGGE